MLLSEIKHTVSHEQIIDWLNSLNFYIATNRGDYELDVVVRKLCYIFPEVVYRGNMFRVIDINRDKFVNAPSAMFLTKGLQNWAMTKKRKIVSWSKDMRGVFEFVSSTRPKVGIMIAQEHVGLDVKKLYELIDRDFNRDWDLIDANGGGRQNVELENEILAVVSNDVHLTKIVVRTNFFNIDDIELAANQARFELEL